MKAAQFYHAGGAALFNNHFPVHKKHEKIWYN